MCVILLKREIVEMDLCVERVLKSRQKKEIKRVYEASFSKEERMPFVLMLCMSGMKNADSVSSFFGTAAVR